MQEAISFLQAAVMYFPMGSSNLRRRMRNAGLLHHLSTGQPLSCSFKSRCCICYSFYQYIDGLCHFFDDLQGRQDAFHYGELKAARFVSIQYETAFDAHASPTLPSPTAPMTSDVTTAILNIASRTFERNGKATLIRKKGRN